MTDVHESSTELAEEMLAEAYEYVLSGWCQGASAQDESGRPIEPASAFARRWSALGALERAWRRSPADADRARRAYERARLALIAAVNDMPQPWNDAPGRHQSEALSALAESLQLVEAPAVPRAPAPVGELMADLDPIGSSWAIQDAIFEGAGGEAAEPPLRAESPLEP